MKFRTLRGMGQILFIAATLATTAIVGVASAQPVTGSLDTGSLGLGSVETDTTSPMPRPAGSPTTGIQATGSTAARCDTGGGVRLRWTALRGAQPPSRPRRSYRTATSR